MHLTAFLKVGSDQPIGPMVAVHGKERHLKRMAVDALKARVLGPEDADVGLTRFAGRDADLATVLDELRTVSMWGDARLVIVDDAEDFVSKHRAGLESYLEKPAKTSVLVLDVTTWPKTTRLAKAVAKIGLELECRELTGAELIRWLSDSSRDQHGKQLGRDGAALMVELAGSDLGLLDQELSKLAAYVGDRAKIEPEDVRTLVGGWKAETTWFMLDALRDGRLDVALGCLDKLLIAGEAPQKLLGGIGYVFRKFAHATELSRTGTMLNDALKQAGVFPRDVAAAAAYLRRIGRPRAEKIQRLLLDTDTNLKGGSRVSERLLLEQLFVELSGKL